MRNESDLRRVVLKMLEPIHAVHVEPTSGTNKGIPDVNCVLGWIELKFLAAAPSREDTVVRPSHFQPEQRNWLRRRCMSGGRAWLLLVVGPYWILEWGIPAANHIGIDWTLDQCLDSTQGSSWAARPTPQQLINALR